MKLNAPKVVTWIICIILLALGLLCKFAGLNLPIKDAAFWCVTISAILSIVSTVLPGL